MTCAAEQIAAVDRARLSAAGQAEGVPLSSLPAVIELAEARGIEVTAGLTTSDPTPTPLSCSITPGCSRCLDPRRIAAAVKRAALDGGEDQGTLAKRE